MSFFEFTIKTKNQQIMFKQENFSTKSVVIPYKCNKKEEK